MWLLRTLDALSGIYEDAIDTLCRKLGIDPYADDSSDEESYVRPDDALPISFRMVLIYGDDERHLMFASQQERAARALQIAGKNNKRARAETSEDDDENNVLSEILFDDIVEFWRKGNEIPTTAESIPGDGNREYMLEIKFTTRTGRRNQPGTATQRYITLRTRERAARRFARSGYVVDGWQIRKISLVNRRTAFQEGLVSNID